MEQEQEQNEPGVRAKAEIRNNAGIHCRPTAVIVKEARTFDDEITVSVAGDSATGDPKSAIELLSLGLDKGTKIEIHAVGPTAARCVERMVELFETEFDFPARAADEPSPCGPLLG
jgi:phosphocarrier protein HPr